MSRAEGASQLWQQEPLNQGCGQTSSSSSVFPIPAILQPCQGVASLRDCPQPSGLTHLPNQGTGPGAAVEGALPRHRPRSHGSSRNPGQEVLSPEDGALWPAALGEGVRAMCSDRNNTGLRIRRHGSESQFCHLTRREPLDKPSPLPGAQFTHWSTEDSAGFPPT